MPRLILAAALLFAAAGPASADIDADTILAVRKSELAQAHVRGLGEAFGWANARINRAGGQELFCAPPKLGITVEQYMAILAEEVRLEPRLSGRPAGYALLRGLERVFPCPQP